MGIQRGSVAVVVVDHRKVQAFLDGGAEVEAPPLSGREVGRPARRDHPIGARRSGRVGTIGSDVFVLDGGKLALFPNGGPLTITGTQLDISDGVLDANSQSLVFEVDVITDKVVLTLGQLNVGAGVLEFDDFNFIDSGVVPGTYALFDTTQDIFGALGTNLSGFIGLFPASIALAD